MFKYLRLFLIRIWPWYRNRYLYVIADPTDNSITLSRALFDLMDVMSLDVAKVFVFHLCNACTEDAKWSGAIYAFTLNPPIEEPTQLADIQYNSKHHTIGFESLNPSVNRIFYDYGLPSDRRVKLSVKAATVPVASVAMLPYYIIMPPHGKSAS